MAEGGGGDAGQPPLDPLAAAKAEREQVEEVIQWLMGARRPRDPGDDEEDDEDSDESSSTSEEEEEEEPVVRPPPRPPITVQRKYYWSFYKNSGFPSRVNHAVTAHQDAEGEWYSFAFGGYHASDDQRTVLQADQQGGPFFKSTPIDVHCLEMDTKVWREMDPPNPEKFFNVLPHVRGKIPGSRYGHTVAAYKGRVFMFGGRNDEDGSFQTMECYDIAKKIWLQIRCSGEAPSSRDGHACAILGDQLFIHGGFSASEIKFSNETYCFNMSTHVWRKLPHNGRRVPERDFHTCTAVPSRGKLVVFGGRSDVFCPFFTGNEIYDSRFFICDIESNEWDRMEMQHMQRIRGRRSHVAAAFGCNVIFFGGYNAVTKQHFGDLYIANIDTRVLTEIRPYGDAPSPRRRVGCALMGTDLMICGGTSPIPVVRDGKESEVLHDIDDMFVLHLLPSLEQLCLSAVATDRANFDLSMLPPFLQQQIEDLSSRHTETVQDLRQLDAGPDASTSDGADNQPSAEAEQ